MEGRNSTACAAAPDSVPVSQPSEPHSVLVFSAVYRDYFEFVWSCTRRLGVGGEAIDDVVQEILIVIHARLHTLERTESLRSWIYGIVRRTVSTYHRSRRTKEASMGRTIDDSGFRQSCTPTPLDIVEQSDQMALLWELLNEVGDAKREVFILAELEEMTVPEIAEALEIPVPTAYSRLRAARIAFEEAFARHNAKQGIGGQSCRK
jgi:RNA polymerase sigma-70 factor (ECF subfamily)